MRVFVTGATGFIGSAIVQELIGAGHQVLGLAGSEAGAKSLIAAGAMVHRGGLEDLESVCSGAAAADVVIHTAFIHDFSKFAENCEIDKRAIGSLGSALEGSERPLLVTSGLATVACGRTPTEQDAPLPLSLAYPRASEATAETLLKRGVRVSVVRLPQVHNNVKQGLVTDTIALAREKRVSAYRLALEKHEAGARYHAVAEEGVPYRDIAEAIGRGLKVPVVSKSPAAHFLWLGMFVNHDLMGSSGETQRRLEWRPGGPGLIADLEQMRYSESAADSIFATTGRASR